MNREDLINEYVERITEQLDTDTLVAYAIFKMREDMHTYTDEQLRTEIMDYYPDLLEEQND